MLTEILWNYYKALSEPDKNTGFSIHWFYTGKKTERNAVKIEQAGFQDWTQLNDLTKAFLADDDAMDRLKATCPMIDIKTVEAYCQSHYGKNAHQLNESQKKAIMLAINNPITIVQGPPGTGKTETIKNLLICLREHDPNAKIAMVSTNKDAVDNVESKIKDCDCLKDVYARLGNKSLRFEFAQAHPNHKMSYDRFNSDLLNEFPIVLSTIHSLRRCINFDNQYDYVIVDECSQVSTRLGLLAMASSKHLVLFGDDNQLSPIHNYSANDDLTQQVEEIGEYYLDRGDNSFMHACYERFGDKAAKIMLNEHYRCHPNIINFCNKTFYDGKLKISSAKDNDFPIRIRWYEGDYWERIYKDKNEDKAEAEYEHDPNNRQYSVNNYNMKQIEIFIEEELPDIIKKFIEAQNNNSEYSMCVLSPYKCQIKKLTEKFNDNETLNRLYEKIGLTPSALGKLLNGQQNSGANNDNPDEVWDLPSWTLHSNILKAQNNKEYASSIHKAQGKEYDYVCVMPVVDDTNGGTWNQSARITNVAISRAKKELCYIMSSNWMPKTTQEEIMDDRTKEMLKEMLNGIKIKPTIHNPPDYEKQNMGYLPKLVEYVIQNEDKWKDSANYGLIRTGIHSIFDIDYIYREICGGDKMKRGHDMSTPEKCLCDILYHKIKNDEKNGGPLKGIQIHYDLRLGYEDGNSNVDGMNVDDDNAKEYIKNARFDFVLTRGDDAKGNNGKIALIIEVDGAQHRGATDFDRNRYIVDFDAYRERQTNDELKNSLVRTIGADFYEKRFLRLYTDGTTCDEIELIIDRIKEADENKVIQPKFRRDQ